MIFFILVIKERKENKLIKGEDINLEKFRCGFYGIKVLFGY